MAEMLRCVDVFKQVLLFFLGTVKLCLETDLSCITYHCVEQHTDDKYSLFSDIHCSKIGKIVRND